MNEINKRSLFELEKIIQQIEQKQDELNNLIDKALCHSGQVQFISLMGNPNKIKVVVYIPRILYLTTAE